MRRHRVSGAGFGRRYALALGVAIALVVVGILGVEALISQKLSSVPRVNLSLATVPAGGANYLLVGSDTRSFVSNSAQQAQFGSTSQTQGQRSDTIMVLHTQSSGRSVLVSIPRDLWVNVPGQGMSKINSAYDTSPQKLVDTITANLDIPIHHFVSVDFATFQKIVDAVGSVPVYFPAATRDAFSDLNIVAPGCYQLNGTQALEFVRSRDTQVLDPATHQWKTLDAVPDIGRIGRQQQFMREIAKVATDTVLSDPFKATTLVDSVTSELTLDSGFSRSDLFNLVDAFRAVNPSDPNQLQTETLPWENGPTQQGQDVLYLRQPAAGEVLATLRDFSGGGGSAVAPSAIAPSSVHVRVLNGSGANGLAAKTLTSLEQAGFVGAGTGNNPQGQIPTSQIRYPTGNAAAATLLSGYDPGARLIVDDTVPAGTVEFVLGRAFTGLTPPTTASSAAPAATPSTTPSGPQPGSLAPVPGAC
ncbi:MAG TPA: LCP family protein [Acidimicrobiia bacterium]|nr:LCP family protein [Acidimicrobiia bacterium]